jgi:hypothetical protein
MLTYTGPTKAANGQSLTLSGVLDEDGITAISGRTVTFTTTTCAGSTGSTSIASISVGGIPLNINVNPGADTTISVLGITLVLNEQIPVSGPDRGLTVNAVHIKALGLLDVIVGSSTSDIGNC